VHNVKTIGTETEKQTKKAKMKVKYHTQSGTSKKQCLAEDQMKMNIICHADAAICFPTLDSIMKLTHTQNLKTSEKERQMVSQQAH